MRPPYPASLAVLINFDPRRPLLLAVCRERERERRTVRHGPFLVSRFPVERERLQRQTGKLGREIEA